MSSIQIENCNNIPQFALPYEEGEVTVLFGPNGSGKSTIAQAIASKCGARPNELEGMRPYGSEEDPKIAGIESGTIVRVFDEQYISETLFQDDDHLIEDGYHVFVETPQYKAALSQTEQIVSKAKKKLETEGDLSNLITTTRSLLGCYGKAPKGGYAKNSPLGKSVDPKGDIIKNVPEEFLPFMPLIQGESAKAWIAWHAKGLPYSKAGVCPFCGEELDENGFATCEKLQNEYGGKYVDHSFTVFEAFGEANQFLSEIARNEVDAVLHSPMGACTTPEAITMLKCIKLDAETLLRKLDALEDIGFGSLRDIDSIEDYIKDRKIRIEALEKMNSPYIREKVENINTVIDDLLDEIIEVKRAIGQQNSALRKALGDAKIEMNAFLAAAGFPYELELDSKDGNSCIVALRPTGIEARVAEPKKQLSYGERNALAIALFSAQIKQEKPDLVILDDPISSFDETKKYAIIQRLFSSSSGVCSGLTTLLLTHDSETLVIMEYVHKRRLCPLQCFFARNTGSELEITPIEKNDLSSAISMLEKRVQEEGSLAVKVTEARQYIELTSGKSDPAWSVLSCLIHRKEQPDIKEGDHCHAIEESEERAAANRLSELGFSEFSYDLILTDLSDKALLPLYRESCCSLEKICIFRILTTDNPLMKKAREDAGISDVVAEFANEFFHIENLMLYRLDPAKFDSIPRDIIAACDRVVEKYMSLKGNPESPGNQANNGPIRKDGMRKRFLSLPQGLPLLNQHLRSGSSQ